ncbi:NADP-dependent oxidoreductase domain-containing protein [Flagelloscypha sp. PMI_526]|nr:NADP-dependent oxidoreductase domain-containing protein [Flagelloscypha sp. PMI_526]
MASQTKVHYRRLGRSGLRVSVPIFGGLSVGNKEWQPWVVDGDDALQLLKAAWDKGITTYDTANVYSNGVSEEILGKFIKEFNIPRSRIILLTKCSGLTLPDNMKIIDHYAPVLRNQRDNINQYGLSRASIFNQVKASLERFGTDYIDLLQIHRFDKDTPVEETMKAFHDLIQMGKVRYIGASSMRTWQFALMNEVAEKNGWTKFISMQNEYSLVYREEEREMIPYCKFHGIGVIPWRPLGGGMLARPKDTETQRTKALKGTRFDVHISGTTEEIVKRVQEVAARKGWTMAQVSLSWVQSKIDSPIIGMSNVSRIDESVFDEEMYTLSEEDVKYLEEPYAPVPVRGHE